MDKKKIKSFTDLDAWKEGHKLVLMIYKTVKKFPKEELFCLTSQLKRAVTSNTSNLAEGFSRSSYKDKMHFYVMALGSVTETQNQILVAKDVGYLSKEEFSPLADQTVICSKLNNGLIKSSRNRIGFNP